MTGVQTCALPISQHVGALIERIVPAVEGAAHLGGCVVAFMADFIHEEIDGLLGRPEYQMEAEREDDARAVEALEISFATIMGGNSGRGEVSLLRVP